MKLHNILLIVILLLSLWSCNNSTKENKDIIKETVKAVKEIPKTNDFRERLKATEPATEAQFQNWLPIILGDLKRTEFTSTRISQNDIASAGAIYTNGDNKKIILTIVDGASKDGLLAIQSHYMAQNTALNSTKTSGYEKTYEHNGLKVLETYVKDSGFYRVLYLYNLRFGITLESHGLSYDELWQVISEIDFNKLNTL